MDEQSSKKKPKKSLLGLFGFSSPSNVSLTFNVGNVGNELKQLEDRSVGLKDWEETDSLLVGTDDELPGTPDAKNAAPAVPTDTYATVLKRIDSAPLLSSNSQETNAEIDVVLCHSRDTVTKVQQSEDNNVNAPAPATLYKAGLLLLAFSGVLSLAATFSGIYPIFGLAGMLAVLGGALMLTAYVMNDEKRDGSLTDQVFPPNPTASFLPASGLIYGM